MKATVLRNVGIKGKGNIFIESGAKVNVEPVYTGAAHVRSTKWCKITSPREYRGVTLSLSDVSTG